MKKCKTILLSVFICTNLFSQTSIHQQSKTELKKEAFDFSLSIIQTFFNNDCDAFKDKLTSNIYSIIDEEFFVDDDMEDLNEDLCSFFEDAVTDKSKTFEDYKKDYTSQVLTQAEFLEKTNCDCLGNLKNSGNDFFFLMDELKDTSVENYLWDEWTIFILRKVDGKWIIMGG